MSEKKFDELLDHDYDGIQEFDNPLPPWWLMLFYITIIFTVVYMPYYHFMGDDNGQASEYKAEMAAWEAKKEAYAAANPAPAAPANLDPAVAGQEVFKRICHTCHKDDGGGFIGPNLTDDAWKNGNGTLESIRKVVTEGVPAKGMPPMGGLPLTEAEVDYVSQFIVGLRGTTPAEPKEPEGNMFDASGNPM